MTPVKVGATGEVAKMIIDPTDKLILDSEVVSAVSDDNPEAAAAEEEDARRPLK